VKIGEIRSSERHLTQEGLEEALDWQVLYGGRLGTNLLELKLTEEEPLAHALGKQLGAEVAWGQIAVDPSLIGVIPKHIADRQEIVPWKLEKRRLKILCCAIDVAQFIALEDFATGTERMTEVIKSSPRRPGFDDILFLHKSHTAPAG